ncbi:hypothetical protein Q7P37_000278 [Cladosporium fusiforme]
MVGKAVTANDDQSVVGRMASRYSSQLHDALEVARKCSKDGSTREYDRCKVEWLESTCWATIHVASEDQVDTEADFEADADVVYMDWKIFEKRAHAGEVFHKPIVLSLDFKDSGVYEVQDYVAMLSERFPHQKVDVQDGETGECRIRAVREANDVADCIGFNLLGFKGAFTRPHVDAFMGTWVRCLSGVKVWIFVRDMSEQDWDDFAQAGPSWSPAGKGRAIILEKDDLLLMPPGLRVLHAVLTLEPSLMEGGMLWDERNNPALLDELLWVAQHQICTNEALAYQLPSIIDTLESWVREQNLRLSESLGASGLMPLVE